MYKHFNKIVNFCFLLVMISCTPTSKSKVSDVSFLLHTYNTQMWGDYLSKRKPNNLLLSDQLLKISFLIGDIARKIGTKSGGLNEDGSLFKPLVKNPLQQEELNEFYESLSAQLLKIKSFKEYESMNKEIDKVIFFVFFDKEGMLSKNKLSSMNVVEAVSTLFILENICYYLVVKYS